MVTGCIDNFPDVAGHVANKFVAYDCTYFQKLLDLETSNFVHIFVFGKPSGRGKNLLKRGVS